VQPEEIAFTVETGNGVVRPRGELDLATAGQVRTALQAETETHGRVTLDLGGLSFLDTSGLRLVLETAAAARRDGFDFVVLRGPPEIQRLFELAGVLDMVPFADGTHPGSR
jgi:anti-anti-sigma factor